MQFSFFDAGGGAEEEAPLARVYTVSEITNRIKVLLESDRPLRDLWLEGEISNWRPAASGHIYFSLKDADAAIRCVIWRSAVHQLAYLPEGDGEAVLAHGHVSVYQSQGQYQLYVDQMRPAGMGALYAQFEALKARLAEEGLFDRPKKPIPPFPRRIGVVTSPAAAAFRDILNVLRRRYPLAEAVLAPSLVQGAEAPPQIVAALHQLAEVPEVDVILLARGGGSIEDLWAFNDELVARAVADSPIPVVCGVGHETDFTIADFAADVRAPTPSAAAELATPDRAELMMDVRALAGALLADATAGIERRRQMVNAEGRALSRLSPIRRIEQQRQRLDDLSHAAARSVVYLLRLAQAQTRSLEARLAALNPAATLSRGYAIVRREADGKVVVSTAQVATGDGLAIMVADGTFPAVVRGKDE